MLKDIWETLEPVVKDYAMETPRVSREKPIQPDEMIQDMKRCDRIHPHRFPNGLQRFVVNLKDFARLERRPRNFKAIPH